MARIVIMHRGIKIVKSRNGWVVVRPNFKLSTHGSLQNAKMTINEWLVRGENHRGTETRSGELPQRTQRAQRS